MVALLLTGSAILLNSCSEQQPMAPIDEETLVSRIVENMTNVTTDNGKKTNRFFTPLLEDYEFAKVPFQEYRKGIEVIGYDSLEMESSNIVADYALFWSERNLWELKGNVVVVGENGRKLYSQQLTWDRKTKKIYSNVDSKVEEGPDLFIGEGFEADEDFRRWTFRKLKGQVSVDVEPSDSKERPSSTAAEDSATIVPASAAPRSESRSTPLSTPRSTPRTTPRSTPVSTLPRLTSTPASIPITTPIIESAPIIESTPVTSMELESVNSELNQLQ